MAVDTGTVVSLLGPPYYGIDLRHAMMRLVIAARASTYNSTGLTIDRAAGSPVSAVRHVVELIDSQ